MINLMKQHVWMRLPGIYICLTVSMFIVHEALYQHIEFIFSPFSGYATSIFFRFCNLLILILFIQQFRQHCKGVSFAETTLVTSCDRRVLLGFGCLGMISLMFVAILLASLGLSEHTFTEFSAQNIIELLVLLLLSATFEQTLINGVFLATLLKKIRPRIALLLTGALFCYLHLDNRGYSALAAINTFLAGYLFGVIFLKTQSIWPAIAFHFGWNTSQSLLLGFNVSGNSVDSIVTTQLTGNALITGGYYGPEGSVLTTVVNLIVILALANGMNFKKSQSSLYQAG